MSWGGLLYTLAAGLGACEHVQGFLYKKRHHTNIRAFCSSSLSWGRLSFLYLFCIGIFLLRQGAGDWELKHLTTYLLVYCCGLSLD